MKIHEYQAKEIFSKYGIPVPKGRAAFSADEAKNVFKENDFRSAMVKAQVLAGGRGKSGGIVKAGNAEEAAEAARKMIGQTLRTAQSGAGGAAIRAVLIEERREF